MTKEEKAIIIQEVAQKIAGAATFYITDGSGMTVDQVNKFRKLCFSKGVEYKVVKNSLIKKALQQLNIDHTALNGAALKGASGLMFSDTANVPAKLLKQFHKSGVAKPEFKGASVFADFYVGKDKLDALASIKSKEELIGDIIALLQAPAQRVIGGLTNESRVFAEQA